MMVRVAKKCKELPSPRGDEMILDVLDDRFAGSELLPSPRGDEMIRQMQYKLKKFFVLPSPCGDEMIHANGHCKYLAFELPSPRGDEMIQFVDTTIREYYGCRPLAGMR